VTPGRFVSTRVTSPIATGFGVLATDQCSVHGCVRPLAAFTLKVTS
jgi:hypothetical protein